jgi:hypothetical protein
MNIKADGFVRRADHVVWKVVEGKGLLLNLEDGGYFDVDHVGLTVWQFCDGKKRLSEIVVKISQKFRTDAKRADKDVKNFIGKLKKRSLIEIVSKANSATTRS